MSQPASQPASVYSWYIRYNLAQCDLLHQGRDKTEQTHSHINEAITQTLSWRLLVLELIRDRAGRREEADQEREKERERG